MPYLLLAALVCLLDQALKRWIVAHVSLGGYRGLLPGLVSLTYVRNSGAAFSLFSEHTWLLALISAGASLLLLYVLLFRRLPAWERVCLAMVLGGAVGNLIDRVANGYVVDMFRFEFVNFAIFNLADAFIDVGALLFAVLYSVRTLREEEAHAS
ncbi:MAG: signal peptidase II [bacterium]